MRHRDRELPLGFHCDGLGASWGRSDGPFELTNLRRSVPSISREHSSVPSGMKREGAGSDPGLFVSVGCDQPRRSSITFGVASPVTIARSRRGPSLELARDRSR